MDLRFDHWLAEALAVCLIDLPCAFLAAVLVDWADPGHRLDERQLRRRFPPGWERARLPFGFL